MLERHDLLLHLMNRLATERADEPALVEAASGEVRTWAQLQQQALRWAAVYRQLGLQPRDRVVTMVPNSFDAYLVWLGAAWSGAIEVPANNMYRGEMLQYVLDDAEASVLVISSRYVDRLDSIAGGLQHLRKVVVLESGGDDVPDLPFEVIDGPRLVASSKPATDLPGPELWDVSCIIYTSGTTGPSKGVLVPWAELHHLCSVAPEDTLRPGDAYYSIYPAFHVSGKSSLYVAALYGAHVVYREALSLTEFWNDIRGHEVRAAALVGPIAAMLLLMPPQDDDDDNPLERVVLAPIIAEIEQFKERFGVRHIGTGYGMTEIGAPIVSGWDPPLNGTCGRRREGGPGYEIKIVDEHDREVPVGTVGELVVRAYEPWSMNLGYWGMPERSLEAWRNGWFHTGDGFREDEDGWLYFVDRMKDAVRRRGENISSFEVEAGIVAHPEVAECAVIGVPSEVGEDDVKAVLVRTPDSQLTPEDLIEFLVPRMPRFMIPRYVEFVDVLPKTDATLRVRKVELRRDALNERTWDREAAGIELPAG